MTTVPTWWVWVSGAFFVIASLAWLALAVLAIRLATMVQAMRPKVESTLEKVDRVAEQVEQLASAARGTVESVGGRAKAVAGAFELIALATASRFQTVSRLLAALGTAGKVIGTIRGLKRKGRNLDNKPLRKA